MKMQKHFYTNERNHQILIALLKEHNIKKVVASPGTANSVFVGSIQNDPFFQIYSSVDERSAAYIACGLSLESGEPVVISCTGATAARNYMSGATEAYYSKLPLIILTSSQPSNRNGHLFAQVTDRTSPPKDVCKLTTTLPLVKSKDEEWECEINTNRALLEVNRNGGGPVHINLITSYSYNEQTALTQPYLPEVRKISRYNMCSELPKMAKGRIGIFVGSHKPWTSKQVTAIEKFCEANNAVVFCDHTSNYYGKYKINYPLAINQAPINKANIPAYKVALLVHIGEVSGEEGAMRMIRGDETWRVSPDGEIRDTFKNITCVFEMREEEFFNSYIKENINNTEYYHECILNYEKLKSCLPSQLVQMPFSNVWIAGQTSRHIPSGSTVVLSILNTLRVWNYSEFRDGINVFCPVGGFGIDGAMSLMLGASLNNASKLCYCITGDLAFFYDLNSIGNRCLRSNVRIMVINNGCGVEFKKSYAMAYRLLEDEVAPYVAAAGHFGNKSTALVRHYAEDLGFEYLSANSKSDFEIALKKFTAEEITEKPILLEVFVDANDEVEALNIIHNRK